MSLIAITEKNYQKWATMSKISLKSDCMNFGYSLMGGTSRSKEY